MTCEWSPATLSILVTAKCHGQETSFTLTEQQVERDPRLMTEPMAVFVSESQRANPEACILGDFTRSVRLEDCPCKLCKKTMHFARHFRRSFERQVAQIFEQAHSTMPAAILKEPRPCECGVKHTGGLHSDWCPAR